MAWFGEAYRVRLHVDLTRYHEHLSPGVEGVMVPGKICHPRGGSKLFVAVQFDCCGHTLDVLNNGDLEIIDPRYQERMREAVEARIAEMRRAFVARLFVGPRGGVRRLEYDSTDVDGVPVTREIGNRTDIDTSVRIFEEACVEVRKVEGR
jgi:hypothetical protein